MKRYLSVLVLFFILFISSSQAQKLRYYPTNHDRLKQHENDVYILKVCSPNHLSFKRFDDNSKQNYEVPIRRMSINVNRLSAFQIEGINPLRHSFYLDNQSIAQFLVNEDIVTDNFKKDTANLKISEIDILDIFHSDSLKDQNKMEINTSKVAIDQFQAKLNGINDKWYYLETNIRSLSAEGVNSLVPIENLTANNKNLQKKLDSLRGIYHAYRDSFEVWNRNIANELKKYNTYLNSLIINNNFQGIITEIETTNNIQINFHDQTTRGAHEITKEHLSSQCDSTTNHLNALDEFLQWLTQTYESLDSGGLYPSYNLIKTNLYDPLPEKLGPILAFASNKAFRLPNSSLTFQNMQLGLELNFNSLREYILSEKLSQINYFVLYTSLEIGKLLQKTFTSNSVISNDLSTANCISDMDLHKISQFLQDDIDVYNYVQDVSSNLNVLIRYAQLNDPAFNSTIKGINDDYKSFLKYIKVLDFVNENNTKQFTLPSTTNLKNVDIIRYAVTKVDKMSGRQENYTYDLWLKGGLKVDFSVAILMSGLKDCVYNKDALFKVSDTMNSSGSFESNQRTDSFLIKKQGGGKYNFAFGGMVNVMLRSGASWITPGASIGVAYGSATNSKLQFLGALSLQFGKSERIIAHFGVVAGEANRLDVSQLTYNPSKDVTENDNTYKVKGDFSTTPIPTAPKFLFRPFFGISYSLSKKNALNAVGSQADNYNNAYPKNP